jgi:hypothetical protein
MRGEIDRGREICSNVREMSVKFLVVLPVNGG